MIRPTIGSENAASYLLHDGAGQPNPSPATRASSSLVSKQWGHGAREFAAHSQKGALVTDGGASAAEAAPLESGWQPGVLVTGGREFIPSRAHATWFKYWLRAVRPAFLIHGGARGVDLWSEAVARAQGMEIQRCPATPEAWATYGGAAGAMRNTVMLEVMLEHGGGYCIAFDGGTGTADMMRKAEKGGLRLINMQTPHYKAPARQKQLVLE